MEKKNQMIMDRDNEIAALRREAAERKRKYRESDKKYEQAEEVIRKLNHDKLVL